MTDKAIQAWRDLCAQLERLGTEVIGEQYASADPMEMLEHLVDQTVCWLDWSVFHGDPTRPFFHRSNDLVTQYGGPNADNVYRHARIDPDRRYRIAGRMHGCQDWLLTLRAGFMHEPVYGTLADHTASELGIEPGTDFELLLGGADGIPIPDGVRMATIREYYFDWTVDEPATFTIECLDPPGAEPPLTDEVLAARIGDAGTAIEHSITYWARYLDDVWDRQVPNEFAPSHHGAKGLSLAQYAFCTFDLAPDEALVVDTDLARARYWSLHLYPMGTFAHMDVVNTVTSINSHQAVIGDDGRLHAVVSAVDPGVENWLCTGGRRRGLLTYRWFWPLGDAAPPEPQARVVKVDALDGPVTERQREADQAARRSHLAWRFRE
jgi:hypothetical protein